MTINFFKETWKFLTIFSKPLAILYCKKYDHSWVTYGNKIVCSVCDIEKPIEPDPIPKPVPEPMPMLVSLSIPGVPYAFSQTIPPKEIKSCELICNGISKGFCIIEFTNLKENNLVNFIFPKNVSLEFPLILDINISGSIKHFIFKTSENQTVEGV
jgi:hypothetical protein